MSFYYNNHVRNLEQQSTIQKQKNLALLHQNQLLQRKLVFENQGDSPQRKLKRSRRDEEERQTSAYLERSRLEAELNASRSKAECTMNRSRIEAAFALRKQNQKAHDEQIRMEIKHNKIRDICVQQENEAFYKASYHEKVVQQCLRQQSVMAQVAMQERLRYEKERDLAYKLKSYDIGNYSLYRYI